MERDFNEIIEKEIKHLSDICLIDEEKIETHLSVAINLFFCDLEDALTSFGFISPDKRLNKKITKLYNKYLSHYTKKPR